MNDPESYPQKLAAATIIFNNIFIYIIIGIYTNRNVFHGGVEKFRAIPFQNKKIMVLFEYNFRSIHNFGI